MGGFFYGQKWGVGSWKRGVFGHECTNSYPETSGPILIPTLRDQIPKIRKQNFINTVFKIKKSIKFFRLFKFLNPFSKRTRSEATLYYRKTALRLSVFAREKIVQSRKVQSHKVYLFTKNCCWDRAGPEASGLEDGSGEFFATNARI